MNQWFVQDRESTPQSSCGGELRVQYRGEHDHHHNYHHHHWQEQQHQHQHSWWAGQGQSGSSPPLQATVHHVTGMKRDGISVKRPIRFFGLLLLRIRLQVLNSFLCSFLGFYANIFFLCWLAPKPPSNFDSNSQRKLRLLNTGWNGL